MAGRPKRTRRSTKRQIKNVIIKINGENDEVHFINANEIKPTRSPPKSIESSNTSAQEVSQAPSTSKDSGVTESELVEGGDASVESSHPTDLDEIVEVSQAPSASEESGITESELVQVESSNFTDSDQVTEVPQAPLSREISGVTEPAFAVDDENLEEIPSQAGSSGGTIKAKKRLFTIEYKLSIVAQAKKSSNRQTAR